MKIQDYREAYYAFSKQVSDIIRQLALAGLGVVWILKPTPVPGINAQFPMDLLWPSLALLIALALDLLQYITASIIWRLQYRALERSNIADRENHDFGDHESWKEQVITTLFAIKVVVAVIAWGGLLYAVVHRLLSDGTL